MKILITGAWSEGASYIDKLQAMGHTVWFQQYEKDPLPIAASEIDGVICNGLFLHHPIESFCNLRYIQLTSAGFDRIDLDYAKEKGIIVNNARGVYSIPMAEHAVMGVLALYRQLGDFYSSQKNHCWEKRRTLRELNGKTVCIIGVGSVGTACARRFSGFDCRVIGVDILSGNRPYIEKVYSLEVLPEVLRQSDIVVLTLPLTENTRNLFDEQMISHMKQGSVLVNIARGQLISQEALCKALREKLMGAVLDVFDQEPLPEASELWDMPNVLITPHNSFVGEGNPGRLTELILKNLESI